MKKSLKLLFCGKKWGPIQWFCSREKKLQVLEKNVFRKKNSSSLFVQIWSSKQCAEFFFKINGSWDCYISMILRFWKMLLHNKVINEIRSIKNQENSAHRFVDNYLANHLAKFLQEKIQPWRVVAYRVCTGYHFFQRKSLVRAF